MQYPMQQHGPQPPAGRRSGADHPEWQDPGDAQFERFVIEAPPDCTRVLIRTIVHGLAIHPTEWIEAGKLARLADQI
jgi:hypothetical protein